MNILFVLVLSLILLPFLFWAFRNLPKENWQVLACVPGEKSRGDARRGTNYTWYGFFLATAYVSGVLVFLILMGSIAVPITASFVLIVLILSICTPLAGILARLVEGKRFTLTVGGAVFAGLMLAPWIIEILNVTLGGLFELHFPVLATLCAMAIAHVLGEGMGRLACISFGCCYGKPLHKLPEFFQKLLAPFGMTFFGKTKKIAYAHGLDGQPVVPVQAMTSFIYVVVSLWCIWLFLEEHYVLSFSVSVGTSHGWRILSELLRADYRGNKRISAYQIMSLLALPYATAIIFLFPPSQVGQTSIAAGLASFWSPEIILFLQVLWFIIFLFTGRSQVTAAEISLYVVKDRI
jgi:hypothetical protein